MKEKITAKELSIVLAEAILGGEWTLISPNGSILSEEYLAFLMEPSLEGLEIFVKPSTP